MDDKHKKFLYKIQRQMTLKEAEHDTMLSYDAIVAMEWDGIPGLKDKDWYVEFKDPTGRDLIQQAVNIYATQSPKFNVLPLGPNDVDRAERAERFIEWHMKLIDQMGAKPVNSATLTHVTKYNKICSQLEYRPYWDKSAEAKAAPFCEKPYHPYSVFYEFGISGPQWVAVVQNLPAVDVIEHWGGYGNDKKIKAAVSKIQKLVDDDEEARVMYIDYTDKGTRWVYCYQTSGEDVDDALGEDSDIITVFDGENKLGFVNWAIVEGEGDALLTPLHSGDLWKNTNTSETILRSDAYRKAFQAVGIVEGTGPNDVEIDYSGDEAVITVPAGKRFTPIPPRPLDPAFSELAAKDRNLMTSSVGIGNVAGMQAANTQFSTINALIQLRLAQLDPYKRTWERHRVQIAKLMFRWMEKESATLTAYRTKSKKPDDIMMKRGAMVAMSPDDNLERLFIECELLANNPTDMMQRVNMFMTMRNGGAPLAWKEIFERLQMGEGEINKSDFEDEQIWQAALGAMTKKIQAEADLEIMQAQQQLQMEAQAQQQAAAGPEQAAQGIPQPVMQNAQGGGFNDAMAGGAPAEMSPQMTQTQVQGMDATGAGI